MWSTVEKSLETLPVFGLLLVQDISKPVVYYFQNLNILVQMQHGDSFPGTRSFFLFFGIIVEVSVVLIFAQLLVARLLTLGITFILY